MLENKILRRDFLKAGVGGLIGIGGVAGCRKPHIGPAEIVFIEEPKEIWENVDHVIDNSLEGGFSFDFRDSNGEGVRFGNLVEYKGGRNSLDAEGYLFSNKFNGLEKNFTIASLRKGDSGFALNLAENGATFFGEIGEKKEVIVGDKTYEIVLNKIILPENRPGFFVPNIELGINGESVPLIEGIGNINGLFINLMLKPYHEKGSVELLLSHSYFSSCIDTSEDKQFTGLEHIISGRNKSLNANYFNDNIQEDAYFRIDASVDSESIILNATDKIRVLDSDTKDYPVFVSGFPKKHDIEIRTEDRKMKKEYFFAEGGQLEHDFLFKFSPPLETRISLPALGGTKVIPGFFNIGFESDGKKYLVRYVVFDARKIPKLSQPENLGVFYPPSTATLTEIIEEPNELNIILNEKRRINIGGEEYTITLRDLGAFIKEGPGSMSERSLRQGFIFEVEKDNSKEEGLIRHFAHGYPNRILDINIDPDVSLYGYSDYPSFDRNALQRFFVSKNKFSSALDFAGDSQSSGVKKVIIPNYEGEIEIIKKVEDGVNEDAYVVEKIKTGKTIYQQVTLANRLNGRIQNDFVFRADIEFGVDSYEGSRQHPESDVYFVKPASGFDFPDQIKHGYVARIKSFEKIRI